VATLAWFAAESFYFVLTWSLMLWTIQRTQIVDKKGARWRMCGFPLSHLAILVVISLLLGVYWNKDADWLLFEVVSV
jgi:hypothetical protein